MVAGLQIGFQKISKNCVSFNLGKSNRLPIYEITKTRSNVVLLLLHSDFCMQSKPSIVGSRYFVSFIDDYSRYYWVYKIKEIRVAFETFKNWLAMAELYT